MKIQALCLCLMLVLAAMFMGYARANSAVYDEHEGEIQDQEEVNETEDSPYIYLYRDKYFKGYVEEYPLKDGCYNLKELNDKTSSYTIPPYAIVTFWKDKYCTGEKFTVCSGSHPYEKAYIGDYWNDKVSSIRIKTDYNGDCH